MADLRQPALSDQWPNRRIIFLAVVVALIFYAVFRLPPTINYILARARDTVILLILAVALTYFLLPAVNALCRIPVKLDDRTKRAAASLIAIVVFLALVVLLATVIVAPLVDEIGQVLETVTHWAQEDLTAQVQSYMDSLLSRLPIEYRRMIEEQIAEAEQEWTLERVTTEIGRRVQEWGRSILQWHVNLIAGVLSSGRYLIGLLIVPVFAYYFLTDAGSIRTGLESHVPPDARERYHQMLTDTDTVIQRYVRTVMVISLMTGIATALTLYFADVDVFLTFGILAGVANMVPVLGAIVAVVAITAITLLQAGLKTTLVVMIVYGAIQVVTDRVISPKLMAEGAQLHPVAVLVGLLAGAEFFGVIGVFIAVPVLAAARVVWMHYRAYMGEGERGRELDRLLGRFRCSVAESGAAGADQAPGDEPQAVIEPDNTDAATHAADNAAPNGDDGANEHP